MISHGMPYFSGSIDGEKGKVEPWKGCAAACEAFQILAGLDQAVALFLHGWELKEKKNKPRVSCVINVFFFLKTLEESTLGGMKGRTMWAPGFG